MAKQQMGVNYDHNIDEIPILPGVHSPGAGFDIMVLFDSDTPQDIIVDALQRAKERIADSVD